jgi:hypothetical protein
MARAAEPRITRPVPPPVVPDDQPAARQPTLDIPARPRPQAPAPSPVEETIHPGDVICAVCGTPNDPSRTFCRRCGNSLANAAPPRRVPWWRRLFVRTKSPTAAGERPGRLRKDAAPRRGLLGQLVPLLVVAVVAFGLTSYFLMPSVRSAVDGAVTDVRLRFFAQFVDLHPVSASGTGAHGNAGQLAVDDNTATFWLADPGAGDPTLTVQIGSTVNLGGLVVHSGSTTESAFTAHRRPKTIELTFPGTDRPAVSLPLTDTSAPQPVAVDVREVATVVIRIVDWYEAAAGGDQLVAIREIEFKERR